MIMCVNEESLEKLLINSGVTKQSAYTTGSVSKLLSVSNNTVIDLCDKWQPEKNQGLECYRVGTHRRIPHHALIEWLENNLYYNSLGIHNQLEFYL